MNEITLWGRLNSANVQKVVWALGELGLDYRHVPLGGSYGGLADPQYLAMNPNGLVPTLRDGELTLWESSAILRYLAARYGAGSLFPVDASERAIVDQWTDWSTSTFQPAWIAVFWLLVRTPEPQRDAAAIERAVSATLRCFRILEGRLADVPFLGGGQLTYADIVAGTAMYRWMTMPIERPAMPNVEAWYGRLRDRAAFRKGVCVPYDELVGKLAF
ncbi:MAG TPA: glutathione S-transferase family protein [Devosiaceae bacterium]|jgi:glutathione S-transferase|nr:glutathione S-transferase family protein [Devosiaceae bacterium]